MDDSTATNFYFFANQEIPAFNYDMMENKFQQTGFSQHVWNDYVDFKVCLIDNGDDRVTMQVSMNDK